MILEGIVTTCDPEGSAHVAPMGPIVDVKMRHLRLRPFQTSTTFANLDRTGEGVFHVTDDVELLARAAVGPLDEPPAMRAAEAVRGWILSDACRWYAFRITSCDKSHDRAEMTAEVVDSGRQRDFFGFNRAKHAVVEAAILATRTEFLDAEFIATEFERLRTAVQKTGAEQEHRAMRFLEDFVRSESERWSNVSATQAK